MGNYRRVYLPTKIDDALEEAKAAEGKAYNAIIKAAVEQYLKEKGYLKARRR